MATSNFINHENGLFILEGYEYEEARSYLINEMGYAKEDATDELVFELMNDSLMWRVSDYWEELNCFLPKNLELVVKDDYEAEVYNTHGKIVARLNIEGGYYSGAQVIVTTDWEELLNSTGWYAYDTMSDVYEEYSPHNKRLFKAIAKTTTALNLVGVFSNGEAVYERA